jgi:hypothetical protein
MNRMRLAAIIATFLWAAQFSGTAAADLYRWVDPDTGSVKFSSYPPPWYGDEAKQHRAPKVEVIPARSEPVVKPETPGRSQEGARKGDAPAKPAAGTRPST